MNKTERAFVIDKQLQKLFSSQGNERAINESNNTEKNSKLLSMQAIVNAILDPNLKQSKQTVQKVNTSSQYLKWYTLILASYSNMQSASQVAASSSQESTKLLQRKGRGFSLEFNQPVNKPSEMKLVVTIEHTNLVPQNTDLFLHSVWQEQLYVVKFGVPVNNMAEALVSMRDVAFNAIANPESHLYLT